MSVCKREMSFSCVCERVEMCGADLLLPASKILTRCSAYTSGPGVGCSVWPFYPLERFASAKDNIQPYNLCMCLWRPHFAELCVLRTQPHSAKWLQGQIQVKIGGIFSANCCVFVCLLQCLCRLGSLLWATFLRSKRL